MYFDRFWSGNEAKQKKDKDRNNVLIGDWNEDKVVMD